MVLCAYMNIASGIEQYEVGDILAGVGFCLLPSYLYVSSKIGGRHERPYRWVSATVLIAFALTIVGSAMPIFGINPVMWIAGGSHVTPSALIQHPFIYNHQHVETDGYLATNEYGGCMVEVGPAAESQPPATNVIVLVSNGLRCKPDAPKRIRVSVSGTFRVFNTAKGFDIPFWLENAKGIPAALRKQ